MPCRLYLAEYLQRILECPLEFMTAADIKATLESKEARSCSSVKESHVKVEPELMGNVPSATKVLWLAL